MMKVKLLTIGVAIAALSACGSNYAESEISSRSDTHAVCGLHNVPSGVVVIQIEWTTDCGGGPFDRRTFHVRRPKDGLAVCKVRNPPSGYLKTDSHYSGFCKRGSGIEDNAYVLEKI
jgi:hypothetical protein